MRCHDIERVSSCVVRGWGAACHVTEQLLSASEVLAAPEHQIAGIWIRWANRDGVAHPRLNGVLLIEEQVHVSLVCLSWALSMCATPHVKVLHGRLASIMATVLGAGEGLVVHCASPHVLLMLCFGAWSMYTR